MKLRTTHFFDPRPQKMDYAVVIGHNGSQNEWGTDEKYFEAHSAWKARQVKPEPEWIDGKIKKPKKGKEIYWRTKGIISIQKNIVPSNDHDWFMNNMFEKEWCYCENHDKALQHYEENRLRFADFIEEENHYPEWERVFTNGELRIVFEKGICTEFQVIDKATYRGEKTTVELIELISEFHNAELKKIQS